MTRNGKSKIMSCPRDSPSLKAKESKTIRLGSLQSSDLIHVIPSRVVRNCEKLFLR